MRESNRGSRKGLIALLVGVGALSCSWLIPVVAHAQQSIALESAVVDSVSGNTLGVSKGGGALRTFFTLQKQVVYDTLRGIGISVDSLPAEVRASLARFHTQSFEAFRAFSHGLDALDEGRFAEAKGHFEKAAELDPNFALAKEMQDAMPQTNTYSGLQLQAALREAAKNAVSAGKTQVEVDASRAVAALLSGREVIAGTRAGGDGAVEPNTPSTGSGFTSNPPGSGDRYGTRNVVALSYTLHDGAIPVGIALSGEWEAGQVVAPDGALLSVGNPSSFSAVRGGATACCRERFTLGDGSIAHWGTWNSTAGASAVVTQSGTTISAPELDSSTSYLLAPATMAMPTAGSATFTPVGGFLGGATGSISVNFVTRKVAINNLSFELGGNRFAGLNGNAVYSSNVASGFFSGNYASGSCVGCASFSPAGSAFSGNFAGRDANGVVYSTIMQTGNGTVAGVHLFSR